MKEATKTLSMEKLIITPKTKIFDLLEAYPELEETLIAQAPPFSKLKNPLLRKTIARVTTLSQAAAVADLQVEVLVNALRKEAGQSLISEDGQQSGNYITREPRWFHPGRITRTIDVRDMLHQGEQPVHEVLSIMKTLKKKEILEVIAPFLPAPLIDKATGLGYLHWIKKVSEEEFYVYFKK
jgi:hypothetical protein